MSRDHGLTRYKHGPDEHGNPGKGCRCARCREACAGYDSRRSRLIAYGRWEYPVDAAGTRRRLQALTFNGWSLTALAGRYGCTLKAVRKMLAYERVSVATAAAVRALYDELWDEPPPEGTPFERRAATMARRYARERGWVPPLAWDDDEIDDPAAVPVPGWDTELRPARQPVAGLPAVAAGIRRARERAGLSQRALAAAVGVTESCVQLWEYAKRTPGEQSWVQLELTLGPLGVVREAGPEAAAREDADAA